MARLIKFSRGNSFIKSMTDGETPDSPVVDEPSHVSTSSVSTCSSTNDSPVMSPQVGKKIAKTWRSVGGKTKIKTKDIIKRWQSLAHVPKHLKNTPITENSEVDHLKPDSTVDGYNLKKTWSVHVWTTWVRRPYEDEECDQKPEGKSYLSSFQTDKFTYYFTDVFDHNKDELITIEDINALNEKMRFYAGWSEGNQYNVTMKEIHADFFECLLEHVGKIEPEYGFEFDVDRIPDRVDLGQWLNMWGSIINGAKAMTDFPIWLQILPKILFKVINRADNGAISYDELRCFYSRFIKLKEDVVDAITNEAYEAFTSCGDFPLTEDIYMMAFANFLIGKTPHGPGKYIFGGFKDLDVKPFQVDYSCLFPFSETSI